MPSNFHKTSERWWRTPGTQKGSPFSSKGGRTKYKRHRDKRVRDGDLSQGGSREGGQVSKHQEALSLVGLWGSFGISQGNITMRGKKKKKQRTEYVSNLNCQRSSRPEACVSHQLAGTGQGGVGLHA